MAGPNSSSSSSSSSTRDSEMASRLQSAKSLTVQTLREITDQFSEERKIGQGAYGKVYKGKLENGEEIAIKMLYNNTPGIDDKQFKHEFENLMRLEHQNIVRLVRYCYETQHEPMQWMGKNIWTEKIYRGLCFEYMQNGSLEKHISDECDGLDWVTRYKIIKGTCLGLKHLHEGLGDPIYHLDLKPENILLDKNMVPKLADFGLSKLLSDKHTMITQSPIGTIGYLPMEFLCENIISNKFDVFSLGVVMIKIIAGHGGRTKSAEMPRQVFLDRVQENWRKRMLKTCQVSQPVEAYCEQVKICTETALSCMEIDRHNRPTVADIVHRLDDTETAIDKSLSSKNLSSMNDNLVRLQVFTKTEDFPYEETMDEYPILVRVTAAQWRKEKNPSVDIVLVIQESNHDRFFSNIRAVMRTLINGLGSTDRLSFMAGNGECIMELTFMSKQGRCSVWPVLRNLSLPDHCGDLQDSVGAATELLKRGRQVEKGHRRAGIVLILVQKQHHHLEISSDFPVHVLDIKQDYQNNGYNEIKLEQLIRAITKVAAIRITLTAHSSVLVSSIVSGGHDSHVHSEGKSGVIHIDSIYPGETMNFIVKLKLGKHRSKLATIGGQYWSLLNASKHLFAETNAVVLRPRSSSPEELAMHPEVAAELVRVRLIRDVLSEFPFLTVGKKREYPVLDWAQRSRLKNIWEKITSSEEGRRAPKRALAALVQEAERYSRNSYDISAWLACHKWQQVITTEGGLFPESDDCRLRI